VEKTRRQALESKMSDLTLNDTDSGEEPEPSHSLRLEAAAKWEAKLLSEPKV